MIVLMHTAKPCHMVIDQVPTIIISLRLTKICIFDCLGINAQLKEKLKCKFVMFLDNQIMLRKPLPQPKEDIKIKS